jgi:hypothetical protein
MNEIHIVARFAQGLLAVAIVFASWLVLATIMSVNAPSATAAPRLEVYGLPQTMTSRFS